MQHLKGEIYVTDPKTEKSNRVIIKDHWIEILNYFDYKFTNTILEDMNSIIQNVKRRARGFRNTEYFKTMIYLNCSDLDIDAVITMA